MSRRLRVYCESFPIRGAFRISRGAKSAAQVIRVEIEEGGAVGQGECTPYARYRESVASVEAQIEALRGPLEEGLTRQALQDAAAPGAARNALDCALWDLDAKRTGVSAAERAGLAPLRPLTTAFTLSLADPQEMARAAQTATDKPLLKLKLAGDAADLDRIAAVVEAAPSARLIVDANEAMTIGQLETLAARFADGAVALIEQPLPADGDGALIGFDSPILLCADESVHDRRSLDRIVGRYGCVNIKLDKTGGLTEALALQAEAAAAGLQTMAGCMVATSLAMAPAALLAQNAAFVDLDGPLLLAEDRSPGIAYRGAQMAPPPCALWG